MSVRSTLRVTLLAAVAAGAVLTPSAVAFADGGTPAPVASTPDRSARPTVDTRTTPAPAQVGEATPAPRGGVAAGEKPAAGEDTSSLVYGSAVGAALLAGAGTIVLRRRSTR
ncbi:hypothetical protein ACFV9D_21205 [Streptomyces sp. NPDC059875]|uniref:hypothetical protein n=1 Tax=unclassified Streptomyces TaxID=2593676 RepID=UPI003667FB9E